MRLPIKRINVHRGRVVDRLRRISNVETICALKVDHIGDFVMALPALQALRDAFPNASIDLVCSPWHAKLAEASGLFSKVYTLRFFSENPSNITGERDDLSSDIVSKKYDLAVDFRVQGETRKLLADINARWYAAVGESSLKGPNVISLPSPLAGVEPFKLEGRNFLSLASAIICQPHIGSSETDAVRFREYRKHENIVVFKPLLLPAGEYRFSVLSAFWKKLISSRPIVVLNTFVDGKISGERRIELEKDSDTFSIEFTVEKDFQPVEVRWRIRSGRFSKVLFYGAILEDKSARPSRAAKPQLHMCEHLMLLVALVSARLNGVRFPNWINGKSDHRREGDIVVAPFSNSQIRNWPVEYFEALIRLMHRRYQTEIVLLGSTEQRHDLEEMKMRLLQTGLQRISVEAGQPILNVCDLLTSAALVISNNSGIGHLAGALGRRVVGIYSASHDVDEWGSVGSDVWLIQAEIECERCGLDFDAQCPNDRRCMHSIRPEFVFDVIRKDIMADQN